MTHLKTHDYRCPLSESSFQCSMHVENHVVVCSIQGCIPGTAYRAKLCCKKAVRLVKPVSYSTAHGGNSGTREPGLSLRQNPSTYDRYPPNRKHWPAVPLFNELL